MALLKGLVHELLFLALLESSVSLISTEKHKPLLLSEIILSMQFQIHGMCKIWALFL